MRAPGLRVGGLLAALILPAVVSAGVLEPALAPAPAEVEALPGAEVAGRVTVSAVSLTLELLPRAGRRGQAFEAVSIVRNDGPTSLDRVVVALSAVPEAITFRPAGTQTLRRLAPGASKTLTWLVCGRAPGIYALTVSASFAGMTITGATRVLEVPAQSTC